MKIRTLEYFIALAEAGSISEAARKMYVAQPSLTKSLQQMEEELGVQLVSRSSTGIRLTEAGETVLREARQVIDFYHGWKELGRENTLEQIDIYTYISFPDFLLPDIILQFRKKYPELTINFSASLHPEAYISRSLQRPVITLMLCNVGDPLTELIEQQGNEPTVLMQGEYRCLVNADSPLAKKESVTVQDLSDYYMILPNFRQNTTELSQYQVDVQEMVARHRPQMKRIEVQSVDNVISLVAKDPDSYTFAYFPAARRYLGVDEKRLVGVPLQGEVAAESLALFYSRQACARHPVVQELVHAIRDAAREYLSSHQDSEPQ